MFQKVLIAHRGEIALRIIRACKELGIKTVAVHSDVDSEAPHVVFADQSICVGPAPSAKSYLNMKAIISAAEVTGADAIHPGYDFLAENGEFADLCENCGITFIGPIPDRKRRMSDKIRARQKAAAAGIPIFPGSQEGVRSTEEAFRIAEQIGYPVTVKATARGGGGEVKVVHSASALPNAFAAARFEAHSGAGNPDIYIEKFFERPRYVEVQILADNHGNVILIGERVSSVERGPQERREETPSPLLAPEVRKQMGDCAIAAAKALNHSSIGSIEFLLDQQEKFYFLEMSSRVQVDDPVSAAVTDIEIIKELIRVAAGLPLRTGKKRFSPSGSALYAGESSMFQETLREIVQLSDGGIGVVLMGYDGIAIDEFFRDGADDDLSRMAIEYTVILKDIKNAVQFLNTGEMEEVSIKTGKHQLIVRALNEDYFVALTLEAGGNFGKGRFLLMRKSGALRQALS